MKKLFLLVTTLAVCFSIQGAVSQRGGGSGGGGTSTNAFSTLTNLANTGIPALTNISTNLYQRPFLDSTNIHWTSPGGSNMVATVTNSGVTAGTYSNPTITIGADGRVFVAANGATNDATYATFSTTLNTIVTNGTNVAFVTATPILTSTITELAKVGLLIEQTAGTFTYTQDGQQGAAIAETDHIPVTGIVGPGKRFYYTNLAVGSATATLSNCFIVTLTGSAGGGGGGSGTVTSVAVTSDFQTVSGSPITTSGTIALISPYIPANSNMVVSISNGLVITSNAVVGLSNYSVSVSNGLLTLSNSIPALSNAIVGGSNFMNSISNGLLVLSNSIVPLSNGLVLGSNGLVTVSNGLVTLSNSIPALSNAQVVISNGLVAVSNGVVVVSNGVVSMSNSVAAYTNVVFARINGTKLAWPLTFTNTSGSGTNANGDINVTGSGGGSSFPLSADANVGGFALTNLYLKNLTFTSAHTLVASESGIAFNNIGCTSREDFTLPAPTVGVVYTFVCMDTDGLRIILPAGTSLILISSLSTSTGTGGGYLDTTTIGNTVTLLCVSSTQWMAISITGGGAWTTN